MSSDIEVRLNDSPLCPLALHWWRLDDAAWVQDCTYIAYSEIDDLIQQLIDAKDRLDQAEHET